MIVYKKLYDVDGYLAMMQSQAIVPTSSGYYYDIEKLKKYNLDGYVCVIGADHLPKIIRRYYYNGKLHRKDKPAIEYEGNEKYFKFYWLNGLQHREDGPARITSSEDEYYYEGKEIWAKTNEEFRIKIKTIKLKAFL